jgi:hypothetical protein
MLTVIGVLAVAVLILAIVAMYRGERTLGNVGLLLLAIIEVLRAAAGYPMGR